MVNKYSIPAHLQAGPNNAGWKSENSHNELSWEAPAQFPYMKYRWTWLRIASTRSGIVAKLPSPSLIGHIKQPVPSVSWGHGGRHAHSPMAVQGRKDGPCQAVPTLQTTAPQHCTSKRPLAEHWRIEPSLLPTDQSVNYILSSVCVFVCVCMHANIFVHPAYSTHYVMLKV